MIRDSVASFAVDGQMSLRRRAAFAVDEAFARFRADAIFLPLMRYIAALMPLLPAP